jgi:rhomboid-related protein 1/2/3
MSNLFVQLILGVLLELVNQWWRVTLIYLAGVLAGSIGTSIVNPNSLLAGASGGVYALITAHLSIVILNWNEMKPYGVFQMFFFVLYCLVDTGFSIYNHITDPNDQVGYIAHLSGSLAGLLIGIGVLQNLKELDWEKKLWWCALTVYFLLMSAGIFYHIYYF